MGKKVGKDAAKTQLKLQREAELYGDIIQVKINC